MLIHSSLMNSVLPTEICPLISSWKHILSGFKSSSHDILLHLLDFLRPPPICSSSEAFATNVTLWSGSWNWTKTKSGSGGFRGMRGGPRPPQVQCDVRWFQWCASLHGDGIWGFLSQCVSPPNPYQWCIHPSGVYTFWEQQSKWFLSLCSTLGSLRWNLEYELPCPLGIEEIWQPSTHPLHRYPMILSCPADLLFLWTHSPVGFLLSETSKWKVNGFPKCLEPKF